MRIQEQTKNNVSLKVEHIKDGYGALSSMYLKNNPVNSMPYADWDILRLDNWNQLSSLGFNRTTSPILEDTRCRKQ
jgi:hypothetical protein